MCLSLCYSTPNFFCSDRNQEKDEKEKKKGVKKTPSSANLQAAQGASQTVPEQPEYDGL